ncbi:protein Shroom3 isoform X2 [Mugil cephalus]|uniref:protein Shroom3 isoform X2 n=1 Tax=Mugil cephalus TaxID=48193 RepID=UPI001FB6B453|nr:protein Shroom3 isoform X2 [Mugil cephalus]
MESGGRAELLPAAGGGPGGSWVLVEALLQGGAPWGFTLQGGLEHGEPLIISKVEEGGKADSLEQPLLVGDELIIINEVELTGYRQEAITLVKGSYKTLQLTVRRVFDTEYIEVFLPSPSSLPAIPPPPPPPLSLSPAPQTRRSSSHSRPSCSAVQLRIKNRRSEPASRPHSWHSTKLGDGQQEQDPGAMDTLSSSWHHNYHASASTTDLSGGFDSGGGYLRKSPDQYSSRGSMESLDHPQSSHLHSGAQHQLTLGHHGHGGSYPAYSSCHQLSSARSSNSIDHLHSKRDSAYSSFSTNSSIPEYLASTPSFSPERSYSLETVSQRGGGSGDMQQADMRYVRTVYDGQQGHSQEHELSSTSAALLRNSDPSGGARLGLNRDLQGSVGGVCYRGSSSGSSNSSGSSSSSIPPSNRHSVGLIWGPAASRSSYENLKGAPAPPRRSDSYAAIRSHERPNSWSSLENARSLRSLQKGSRHHSSGPVSSAKGSYGLEGQLHTVIEKSPESSPTTKPRQGGGYPQPPSPSRPSSGPPGPTSLPSRLILPTGMYPVPQPEPHYAQMPSSSSGPGSSGVYPALAKESSRQQYVSRRDERATEGQRDGRMSATENGYQNNTSPYLHPSYSTSGSTQLRTPAHETDRHQQECGSYSRPHIKTTGGGSEGQVGAQRQQNHQELCGQSFQGSHIHTSQGPHSHEHQEPHQDLHLLHIHSAPDLSSQGRSDPYSTVQSRGERSRSVDQTSLHSEPFTSSRQAQGQVPSSHAPVQPYAPATSTSQPSPRHLSDSAVLHYQDLNHREQDKDKEHPLTRLENALAEVQRCASPDSAVPGSSHGNSGTNDGTQGPSRSLSVLEKVNRFERRDGAGKQRSHSSTLHNKANHLRMTDKGRSTPCGTEDLRNMLERSSKGIKPQRTMSYRGGFSDLIKYRVPADPASALQRSLSSFQVDGSKKGDSGKEITWRQDVQEMLGPIQDTTSNRSYRDSLKDAQSKVLRSTSFRRRDLSSSTSSASPTVSPSTSLQYPPVPAKYHSLEKKGPKTMPKPQGIVITPQSQPGVTSRHTPKERHVISPDVRGPSPPALPSIPPVGAPAVVRICGRKRLTAEQKMRSYSEPENLNEVGISDPETAALFRRGGETSVADRRKMFERAASRVGGGAPQPATSRPDLRQFQQDALVEYVERKRNVKRDEGGQKAMSRPHSAYLQPENYNSAVSSCYSDTLSLSSTSSLLSLQDCGPDRSFSAGEMRHCSTLPPGADLRSLQSNLFYPGRVTTPRPPAQPLPSTPPGSASEPRGHIPHDHASEAGISGHSFGRDTSQGHEQQAAEAQVNMGLSNKLNWALERAGSGRSSGKSASAEDLLERLEERKTSPQHCRSRSSPTKSLNQDFPQDDVKMFGVFISESGHYALAADRPAHIYGSESVASPQPSQNSVNTFQSAGAAQYPVSSHTPVARRERQRNADRQRAHSTSTLAASVGLPCPFSPAGTRDVSTTEWQAGERLSQANLDAITFPSIPQTSASDAESEGAAVPSETLVAASPNQRNSRSSISPPSSSHSSVHQYLPSPRISESSQQQPLETFTGASQEDFYRDFSSPLPPPPPPPPLPIKETIIMEDLPLPPPPPELEQEAEQQTVESLPSPTKPQSSTITPITTPTTNEAHLGLEYQPLPKREKTSEECRVEALARQMVLKDPSLVSLLDTWGSKSAVQLMEEIFPNNRQHRDSNGSDDRIQDGVCDPAQSVATDLRTETDLDEEETDLNTRKVELCEALRNSKAALQREKDELREEQKHHQALGAGIETLVQECLKPNERDKYSMFIGDLEKIVNLLLSLCSRLARIDRALLVLETDQLSPEDAAEERDSLHHKRSLLLRQTEDAQELKENLDRRQRVVHGILSGYLTEPQLQDYRLFVSAKPSLLIRQRHLDDLIRQAQDQLTRLAESLPPELAKAHGLSTPCQFSNPAPCSSSFSPLLPPSVIPGPAHAVRPTTVTSL